MDTNRLFLAIIQILFLVVIVWLVLYALAQAVLLPAIIVTVVWILVAVVCLIIAYQALTGKKLLS